MDLPLSYPSLRTGILPSEFFSEAYLPAWVPFDRKEENLPPLSYVVDRLIEVLKIPFLIWEAFRTEGLMQKRKASRIGLWDLSLASNYLELICYLGEREYLDIGLRYLSSLQKIYYLSKIILYSYAALIDSRLLYLCREGKKRQERTYVRLLLLSHLTYLTCMMMEGANLALGVSVSRPFLKTLHFSSLLFDVASKTCENARTEALVTKLFEPLPPKQSLYT